MPVPFAWLLGFAVGSALALLARRELVRGDDPWTRSPAFAAACFYGLAVWGPVAAYFLAFHGDWAYLYAVPWRRVPSAVDLAFVLLAAGAVPCGFASVAARLRSRGRVAPALLFGVPLVLALALAIASFGRLRTSATYAQFHGAFGRQALFATSLGKGIVCMGLILAAGLAISAAFASGRARLSLLR